MDDFRLYGIFVRAQSKRTMLGSPIREKPASGPSLTFLQCTQVIVDTCNIEIGLFGKRL